MKNILLYGPPGSGKSTIGRLLADSLDLPFIDLDKKIEEAAGRSVSAIIMEQGETAFRDQETSTLKKAAFGSKSVIALGGGALLRHENRSLVESTGDVVLLTAGLTTLLGRLKFESNQRPLLIGDLEKNLKSLLARRKEHYDSFSMRIDTEANNPEAIVSKIQQNLGRFHVRGMGAGYDVIIQAGGLDHLGEMLAERGITGTLDIVSDSNIGPLYGQRVMDLLGRSGFKVHALVFPAGERFKTLETVVSLWGGFIKAGLDRKSTIVALGGGITGDLAGFAASVFMRGIPWVGVPTSLLAMVDSSLGGKTGCDLPEGKNLIGAFHRPLFVLSDPDVLSTLPEIELRSGLGEVVKHGIIADPALMKLCSSGYEAVRANLPEIVCRAMAVKIKIIEADPFEQGLRSSLNAGHTLGHALETVSGYRLRHGEAVAIGLVAEARLAESLELAAPGFSEGIARTLIELGLPVQIPPDLPRKEILNALRYDKKNNSGVVRFALPVRIGEVRVGVEVANLDLILSEV